MKLEAKKVEKILELTCRMIRGGYYDDLVDYRLVLNDIEFLMNLEIMEMEKI